MTITLTPEERDFLYLIQSKHGINISETEVKNLYDAQRYFEDSGTRFAPVETFDKRDRVYVAKLLLINHPIPGDRWYLLYIITCFDIVLITSDGEEEIFLYPRLLGTLASLYKGKYEVYNGKAFKTVLSVGLGVVGFVLSGGNLGVAMAAFSIGRTLLGGKKKEDKQEEQEAGRAGNTYGFDSVGELVFPGETMGMIYGDRSVNLNGGVRSSGKLLNSMVVTEKGSQRLKQLFSHGIGYIGGFDPSGLLINQQPQTNFFVDEITVERRQGNNPQAPVGMFPYYSQAVSPEANNLLGWDPVAKPKDPVTSSTTVRVDGDDFTALAPDKQYYADGQYFTIRSKDSNTSIISLDKSVTLSQESWIYRYWQVVYTTSKPVSRLDFNLELSLWARDEDNKIIKHAILSDIYVTRLSTGVQYRLYRIYVSNKNQTSLRRTFSIIGLPRDVYKVQLIPLWGTGGVPVAKLGDAGFLSTLDTGVLVGSSRIYIQVDQRSDHVQGDGSTNKHLSVDKKEQISSNSRPPCQLTTINECVTPEALGHATICGYPAQSLTAVDVVGSDRLRSAPRISDLITQGRRHSACIAAGRANVGSTDVTLIGDEQFTDIPWYNNVLLQPANLIDGSFYVGNLTRRTWGVITAVVGNAIATDPPLYWRFNDRYALITNVFHPYLPDVILDTLLSPQGGMTRFLNTFDHIDYVSFAIARRYVVQNNYYWDGKIDQKISWNEWATKACIGSLLRGARSNGQIALIAEEDNPITASFGTGNMFSYEETLEEKSFLNTLIVSWRDGSDGLFKPKSIVVKTEAAFKGLDSEVSEVLQLPEVTNSYQARQAGVVYMQSRLKQDRTVRILVGLRGELVTVGDIFLVQHFITQVDAEQTGYVIQTIPVAAGVEDVRLSASVAFSLNEGGYTAAVYYLNTRTTSINISPSLVQRDDGIYYLRLSGLPEPLTIPGNDRLGDYVFIGKGLTLRRKYRAIKVTPDEMTGRVEIVGVNWDPSFLTEDGLVVLNDEPRIGA